MTLRRQLRAAVNCGLAILCWSTPSRPQAAIPGEVAIGAQFRIAGTVVSATTAAPLAQTRVSIYDVKAPGAIRSMITSSDGHFEFHAPGAGKYSLQAARRGFIGAAYDQHEQYSTAIVTGAGIDTENLVLRLNPAALLSGTVRDESAEPVRLATVALFREDHSAGVSRVVHVNGTTTDDQGSYEFARLAPGNYFVSATAKPWYAVHFVPPPDEVALTSPTTADRNLDVAYPTTYYPDATDADQAVPIPLKGGDRVQIEIRLAPVPALHLRFHLSEGDGFSMPTLQKKAFDSEQYATNFETELISPGVYDLTGVPAGHYSVRSEGPSGRQLSDVDLVNDGQELDTGNGDALAAVTATVQVLGQKEVPSDLQFGMLDSRRTVTAFQRIDGKGQVHFGDVAPGEYAILAWGPSKTYAVARISSRGAEIQGHTLTVTPNASLDISVSLARGATNVEGIATRAGKGAAGAMVVLVPDAPENHTEFFRRDQSDLDGTFNLRSVIPGTYTIIAIENGWELDWSQPAVLTQYAKHGQTVTVGMQAQASIHLPQPIEVQPR